MRAYAGEVAKMNEQDVAILAVAPGFPVPPGWVGKFDGPDTSPLPSDKQPEPVKATQVDDTLARSLWRSMDGSQALDINKLFNIINSEYPSNPPFTVEAFERAQAEFEAKVKEVNKKLEEIVRDAQEILSPTHTVSSAIFESLTWTKSLADQVLAFSKPGTWSASSSSLSLPPLSDHFAHIPFPDPTIAQSTTPSVAEVSVPPLPTAEDMAKDPLNTWVGRDKKLRVLDKDGKPQPESPLDFFKRVYAPWVGKIARRDIQHIDPSLYRAFYNLKSVPPDDILPNRVGRWAGAEVTSDDMEIYNKVNAIARRRRRG